MGGFSIEIHGLSELDARLTQMQQEQANKAIRHALDAGGEVFQVAVQERAPERPDLPSGTALIPGALANDIIRRRTVDEEGNPAVIVGPGKFTKHVARWVEYGHRLIRGGYSKAVYGRSGNFRGFRGPGRQVTGGDGQAVNVPAHPFIRPAYEASREQAVDAACARLAKDVSNLATRG